MEAPRSGVGVYAVYAVVAVAAVGLIVALFLTSEEDEPRTPPSASNVLVCIDSTESTDNVRDQYQTDLETVVRKTAADEDRIAVAACGNNATGNVNWPVRQRFERTLADEVLGQSQIEHQIKTVIEGPEEEGEDGEEKTGVGIVDLLETESDQTTPIGEMLAVMARQCDHWGGNCDLYLFTDGEWADSLLRVKDGVSAQERNRYLETYVPRLSGLDKSGVYFVGVGLETQIREIRLDEARSVAEDLVKEAGGKVEDWTASL